MKVSTIIIQLALLATSAIGVPVSDQPTYITTTEVEVAPVDSVSRAALAPEANAAVKAENKAAVCVKVVESHPARNWYVVELEDNVNSVRPIVEEYHLPAVLDTDWKERAGVARMNLYTDEVQKLACDSRVTAIKPDCCSVREEGISAQTFKKIKQACKSWDVYRG
jgi:hypothetical protein